IVAQSLVQDETVSSYKWILECILKATDDLSPKKLSQKLGSSYNDFLQNWYRCRNSCSELELVRHWKDLLIQYPARKNYLNQLWKSRQSWAKIYVLTTFCARMQSTQQVESTNGLIKAEVGAKTTLLNLGKAIQIKLECEAQHQQLSDIKIHYLLEDFQLPNAHEYTDGYLED
ncbi:7770_t:CDS:2, partial [Racocetra persica]